MTLQTQSTIERKRIILRRKCLNSRDWGGRQDKTKKKTSRIKTKLRIST